MLLMEFSLLLAPKPPGQLCTPISLAVFAHRRLAKAPCWANQASYPPCFTLPSACGTTRAQRQLQVQERALPDCQCMNRRENAMNRHLGTPQAPARKTVYFLKMSWDFALMPSFSIRLAAAQGNRSAHLNTNRLTTKRRRNRGDHGQRPPRQLPAETALFRRRISTGESFSASICA